MSKEKMAEECKNETEESWLYGGAKSTLLHESSDPKNEMEVLCEHDKEKQEREFTEFDDPAKEMEEDEEALTANNECDTQQFPENSAVTDGDDESDDDVNVVIGEIKPTSNNTFNVRQRPNLMPCSNATDKAKQSTQAGKFSLADFQGSDETINGVAAHEFSIDSLEEKQWRKPGADITDYFNYGFNEMTWRAYCERQKHMRMSESGAGMISLTQNPYNNAGLVGVKVDDNLAMPPTTIMPPPRLFTGMGMGMGMGMIMQRPPRPTVSCKENVIKVLTAECRQYSRMNFPPPPPGVTDDLFSYEQETSDYGYGEATVWMPTSIKELTPSNEFQMQPQPTNKLNIPPPNQVNVQISHQTKMIPPQIVDQKPVQLNIRGLSPHMRDPLIKNSNNNNNNSYTSHSLSKSKDCNHDNRRESRRNNKHNDLKRDSSSFQLRKDFLDMLRERQDITNNTRWHDIKKKLKPDPRYRALDSVYREEYFGDYLHIIIREGKRKRDYKEHNAHRKESSSTRQRTRSWSREKISYRVTDSRKNI